MVQPYPKEGLATSGDVKVEGTQVLQAESPEWKAVHSVVESELARLETRAFVHAEGLPSHPATSDERKRVPFTPELILKVTDRAIYFEGVKTYPPQVRMATERGRIRIVRSGACDILTYAAGWVLLREDGRPKVTAGAEITDCNREGMVYTLPLGLIRRGDGVLWVIQVSGYGYERYEVLEVKGDDVDSVIATPGGWCQ
jgi:hypothetical protein